MIRKLLPIALLGILMFNICGFYLQFGVSQYLIRQEIKKQIRQGLKEEELTVFVIPVNKSGFKWTEFYREFSYKGEMFDVVRVQIKEHNKIYYCINDNKEEKLIAGFNKHHSSKKEETKKLKRLLQFQYSPQQLNYHGIAGSSEILFASDISCYKSAKADIHSPPPEEA